MSGTSNSTWRARSRARQSGVAAVEVAVLAALFFIVVFGAIEIARFVYMCNTLYDATRRAARDAALVSPQDGAALARIRQRAVFRDSPGALPFGMPVTDRHVRIDYLALVRTGSAAPVLTPIAEASLPTCRENRRNCLANPNGSNCVRFVRVRICDDADTSACQAAPFLSLTRFVPMPASLPLAPTINVVESFGALPGETSCL